MKLLENEIYRSDLARACKALDLSELDNKTIAVTGGLGLIGSAVIDLLAVYGRAKKIYVLEPSRESFFLRYGNSEPLEFIEYDALKQVDLDIEPDYIIHCAGLASPELYVTKPVETILTNITGIKNLLEFTKAKSVKRILYISSSEVYGKKETDEAFAEGKYGVIDIDDIRSSYSVAKRASEMLCKAYSVEYGVDTVIVRPGHVYGPSASPKDKRISSDFAYKAANSEKLTMKSSGLQKRSYCYSVDCAAQVLTALLRGETGEAYNIGNDSVTSIREMAQIYAEAGNVELEIAEPTEEEKKAFNPMNNSALKNDKIKALGYRDSFSVREGLTHTVQILKEIS